MICYFVHLIVMELECGIQFLWCYSSYCNI